MRITIIAFVIQNVLFIIDYISIKYAIICSLYPTFLSSLLRNITNKYSFMLQHSSKYLQFRGHFSPINVFHLAFLTHHMSAGGGQAL